MKRSFLGAACALVVAAIVVTTPDARANGRFPESNHIFFSPQDPNLVLLRVTFGALVSHDRGKTWGWACEKSIGTSGVEDPMYAFTPNGTILATTFEGVVKTTDQACSFSFATELKQKVIDDLSQRANDPNSIVFLESSYDTQDDAGNILYHSQLYETKDQGATIAPIGAAIDPTLLCETVDVAAADPERLYVSGWHDAGQKRVGAVVASKDHGATWTPTAIDFVNGEQSVFIAAVDPTNADRIYVRTRNASDQPSRLLVSDDGAKTFRVAFQAKGSLPGFALAADGSKVYVGGPLDGVQEASTADFAFTQRSATPVQCLAIGSDGLWACSNEKNGFIAGLSHDDGATFEAKLHFCDVTGPLSCPAGTPTHDQCTLDWPTQQATLGCGPGEGDGGAVDGGPDAGDGSSGGSGGGGCSCTTSSASPFAASALAAAALALLTARVRRRRPRA